MEEDLKVNLGSIGSPENHIRVRLLEWQGEPRCDIRVYIKTKSYSGPTKKGISLKIRDIPKLIELLLDAQEYLLQKGLLTEDEIYLGRRIELKEGEKE